MTGPLHNDYLEGVETRLFFAVAVVAAVLAAVVLVVAVLTVLLLAALLTAGLRLMALAS